MKKRTTILLTSIILAASMIVAIVADVQGQYIHRIIAIGKVPTSTVAIVLGASVHSDGTPSDALADRLRVGAELYKQGSVSWVLLTGDDGEFHADEIDVMQSFIESKGVPENRILIDGRGFRTYESCKHAKEMGIKHAIVVTQRFHIGRALYLCNRMGIDTWGVTSDLRHYVNNTMFWVRDLLASAKAWWDINIWTPRSPVG